ncbi:MAG: hypothetical protein AB2814_10400 [Candidatus Sedimenticola endophacoides]
MTPGTGEQYAARGGMSTALSVGCTVNLRSGKIPITWHRVTRHFQTLTAMESEAKAVSPR